MYEFLLDDDWEPWVKKGEKFTPAADWIILMCDWHPWIAVDPFNSGIFGLTNDNAQIVSERPIHGPITRLSLLCWWRNLFVTLLDIDAQPIRDGFTFTLEDTQCLP
jgi:hypothetical protein